jgi:S-DNA-T family DNA segregation ATPase FtsK/SpoIIIE
MGRNTVQAKSLRTKTSFNEGVVNPPASENTIRFKKLLSEIRWFISLAACLSLLLILVTYHQADPAWSNNSGGAIKNLGGRAGAYVSDLLLFIFGVSAYWWIIFFARSKD